MKVHLGCCPPVSAAENEALAKLTPQELAKVDLTKTDVTALFSTDNMDALRDAEFKGEGTPDLRKLMDQIVNGFPSQTRDEVMLGLEKVVGTPPDVKKLNLDYDRFVIVRKQQEAIGEEKATELDDEMHPDFMGSRGQLMCGKMLGDAFGIHEVFGALLNPTGGLVGPGNHLIHPMIPIEAGHLDPDNPIALHGIVHDAAGYMNNFHDQGPGYHYLDPDLKIFGTDNPLAGQYDGIKYWISEAGDEYIATRVDAAVVAVEKALKSVRDAVASTIDNMLDVFRSKKDQAIDTAKETDEDALDTAQAIEDAVSKAADAATQAHDTASTTLGPDVPDAAKTKLDAMSGFIWK
ncbi:hypothetical protein [uncultured Tateyamaria sp.]|uniref:hypothetical protein n=1 Tax=uncultured Tateyamaria sp. TaxID=455651 RepID=UPI002635C3AD|nr:hypothetical protein [uncultured Tateyamaria sp.]